MELYHITKLKHLPNIFIVGLKINSHKVGVSRKAAHKSYRLLYNMQPIFLTNDIEFIVKTMLTDDWIKYHKPVVLKIQVELNKLNSSIYEFTDYNSDDEINPKEIRYFYNIEPKYIKIVHRL